MSAVFCSFFSFNRFQFKTILKFSQSYCGVRYKSYAISKSSNAIDLSFGLVAPLPSITTKIVVTAFFSTIEKALTGGVSYIQLWGRNVDLQASLPIISELNTLANEKHVPVIVNNCTDIAHRLGLAGVHLGQKDLTYSIARRYLGPLATIGLTVNTWEHVLAAQHLTVDYLGVQIFASKHTKPPKVTDTPPWGTEGVKKIAAFTRHRIVLIGNITLENLPTIIQLLRPGDGIAIAGEIMRAKDPYMTAREVYSLMLKNSQK